MTEQDQAPLYVIGDIHGHREELVVALENAGLIDADENWSGGDAEVWFLGDFVDRGPDGVGVIELVMRLCEQSDGTVHSLLGNHEILLLGMHKFGSQAPEDAPHRSFERSWLLNGGLPTDQEKLTDKHLNWLLALPVVALAGNHLLMHADTVDYLDWGGTIEEINTAVAERLHSEDLSAWWECWRKLTTRYAFRGRHGPELADDVLGLLGGERIVHGHSVIADQLGVAPEEVTGPVEYADGKVLGVDAGVFLGAPCLIVRLPYEPA